MVYGQHGSKRSVDKIPVACSGVFDWDKEVWRGVIRRNVI